VVDVLATTQKIILVFDDREFTQEGVRHIVGLRRFGSIIFKRRSLAEHFRESLPVWALDKLVHLRTSDDLHSLRAKIEASSENTSLCVIAGRAGFMQPERLRQLVERLPYAEVDFTDLLYKPLLVFLRNAHQLVKWWDAFAEAPIHTWGQPWQHYERVESVQLLNLAKVRDFLLLIGGSTATRYFNQVSGDTYFYTKSSGDKRKMFAEYSFYGLVPESMRPWLVETFSYEDHGDWASYKMLRYYLADTALQWVHGAFDQETFAAFLDRLLFFLAERPRTVCNKAESAAVAQELFVSKVEMRVAQFLASEEGCRIDAVMTNSNPALHLATQVERYLKLYRKYEKSFAFDYSVIGHGDACFSNVLYDQQRFLLKLIDPKGAVSVDELYTHPLYDFCKVSHSVLGDYDFINNGLFSVSFADNSDLILRVEQANSDELKNMFRQRIRLMDLDTRVMRLGEASLFLSMLPLHIDYPNKVIAFILKIKQILDEVGG
jgi:hypothetical protein